MKVDAQSASLYTMKQACELTGLSYETLKYYCKEGLIPDVARDGANRRVFSKRNIGWIKDLVCLRNCGMGIEEMRVYLDLCLQGRDTIPERQAMLAERRKELQTRIADLEAYVSYIDGKNELYRRILDGEIPYVSNLIEA
ncbi:MerR family transcriptional regulator [Eggerthella sinensis]|uniref:MerR family transcriptional regulator n=1 Tax=Eggerthella sinensis TaxID=242230 RepID=UPI00248D4E65|nr:MerR family transcriptional regulator [Eggerthella sinensis]